MNDLDTVRAALLAKPGAEETFTFDPVTLAFSRHDLAGGLFPGGYTPIQPDQPPVGVELGLVTDDVQAAYEQALAAGATPLQAPARKPWGQIVGYVRDLNGVLVELCSPMG
jgi:lactoylglutathione lyase